MAAITSGTVLNWMLHPQILASASTAYIFTLMQPAAEGYGRSGNNIFQKATKTQQKFVALCLNYLLIIVYLLKINYNRIRV